MDLLTPWIEWHGGERPVAPKTRVEVKCRDGGIDGPIAAKDYYWRHYGHSGDIIAYRVLGDQS